MCQSKSFYSTTINNHVYIMQFTFDPLICDNQFNWVKFSNFHFIYLSNKCQLRETVHTDCPQASVDEKESYNHLFQESFGTRSTPQRRTIRPSSRQQESSPTTGSRSFHLQQVYSTTTPHRWPDPRSNLLRRTATNTTVQRGTPIGSTSLGLSLAPTQNNGELLGKN